MRYNIYFVIVLFNSLFNQCCVSCHYHVGTKCIHDLLCLAENSLSGWKFCIMYKIFLLQYVFMDLPQNTSLDSLSNVSLSAIFAYFLNKILLYQFLLTRMDNAIFIIHLLNLGTNNHNSLNFKSIKIFFKNLFELAFLWHHMSIVVPLYLTHFVIVHCFAFFSYCKVLHYMVQSGP